MNPDCVRWTQLSDRDAVGQTVAEGEREFLSLHAQTCEQCSREDAVFRALLAPPASDEQPSELEAAGILGRVTERLARERQARQRRWVAGASGALAIAAGVAVWVTRSGDAAAPASAPIAIHSLRQAPVPPPATSVTRPATASGCAEVVAGVLACTAEATVITRRDIVSNERFLELDRGHIVVSLARQPEGTTFSIVTAAGRVTAVGTVFSVESREDGTTIARVVEGNVAVRQTGDATSRPLRAGESLRLGKPKPSALTQEERERDLALLPPEVRGALPAATGSSTSASGLAPASTPEALLKQALALRSQGQFRRAADVYRKIHEASPRSAAGAAALLSLGELLLSSLNEPAAALTAFDSYLARGGELSQEAAFGKIRALRALRRSAEERSAIEQFLRQYPGSPQSRVLRQRLTTLNP
jgi:ferric-dicitrate binding protein FerR (iron transport regulator)